MSEKFGEVEVVEQRDGGVVLREFSDYSFTAHIVTVPAEHRQAVALALIGKSVDEIVEAGAKAMRDPLIWDQESDLVKATHRINARECLAAVFGPMP